MQRMGSVPEFTQQALSVLGCDDQPGTCQSLLCMSTQCNTQEASWLLTSFAFASGFSAFCTFSSWVTYTLSLLEICDDPYNCVPSEALK